VDDGPRPSPLQESLDDEADAEPVTLYPVRAEINTRLDRFVAGHLPDLSRGYVQQLIDDGQVLVDGQIRRRTFKVTPGEVVTVSVPPPVIDVLQPEPIPLNVVYEDDDTLVIDKPAGLVAHPAPGHPTGTVANAVLHHVPGIAIAGSNRPGIVHRLDKDTSGLMVIAKSDRGRSSLIRQWNERSVEKGYIALVAGVVVDDHATIDVPVGRDPVQRNRMATIPNGRDAVTHFEVEERFAEATLLDVEIETGRTHQIRVHLAFIGHPVVGDPVYNRKTGPFGGTGAIVPRQFLHARSLAFALPSNGERIELRAPLPADLQRALRQLRGEATSSE
jgi:23S rRNA pseudouridine1911/1915/1917 synthase